MGLFNLFSTTTAYAEEATTTAGEVEAEVENPQEKLREAADQVPKCAALKEHLESCAARVSEGGTTENCVEEFFHYMHCVDAQVAPKLMSLLK